MRNEYLLSDRIQFPLVKLALSLDPFARLFLVTKL